MAILLLTAAFSDGLVDFAVNLVRLPFLAIFLGIFLGIYFLPLIIAWRRSHHNTLAIFVLNFLLGWTLVGWVAALVWAVTAVPVVMVQRDSSIAA